MIENENPGTLASSPLTEDPDFRTDPRYPSTREVLENLGTPDEADFKALRAWKREFYNFKWGNMSEESRMQAIIELGFRLFRLYSDGPIQFSAGPWGYSWNGVTRTIYLEAGRPSIVSMLHELGHARYGASELEASRFSTALFRAAFPKAYAKLKWHGHMLVKPESLPEGL